MKKNIVKGITFVLSLMLFVSLVGCSSDGSTLQQITGITFSDSTVQYNGDEQEIIVKGNNIENYTVSYTNNKGTNVGVYNATAKISADGYNDLTLSAKLTITGLDITGITFNDKETDYDGQTKKIEIEGTLPTGVTVAYENNEAANVGVYNAKATLTGTNYETLVLEATLTINDVEGEEITGVTLANKTVTYDGQSHSLVVAGDVSGFDVEYSNNNKTDAGVYKVSVVISKEGYKTLRLEATLTIEKAVITGVSFNNAQTTYDNNEVVLNVEGTLPTGVTVSYTNNKGTNAGVYDATATLTGANYETLELNATLTIAKATITGVTFSDLSVNVDGEEHEILINGTLPTGVTVVYQNNTGTDQGTYNATATLTGANYETLVLEAKLVIKADLSEVALELLKMLTNTPDPWGYLPESFGLEYRYDTFGAINQLDYTNNVNTSLISKGAMGLQMNVLYDTLLQNEKLLGYVNTINLSMSAITLAYQNFINQNPDDYAEFSNNEGNLQYRITLNGLNIQMNVKIGSVCVDLEYDKETETNIIRVQLTDTNALKMESTPSSLIVATNILNTLTSELVLTEDENGFTQGVLNEFANYLGAVNTKSTSYITVYGDFTTVTCNKKESGNIIEILAAVEVYENITGRYLGNETKESATLTKFDTYWFNLADVGINSIKINSSDITAGAKLEGLVNLNGSSQIFESVSKSFSRSFDIELKTFYAYNYNPETEEYEKVEVIIPMIFVQEGRLDTFVSDMNNTNNVTVTVPSFYVNINAYYDLLVDWYLELKELVTQEEVIAYIGSKSDFFN
ncbi:MAG: MBG domain-containing protein [bacterium]